MRMNHLDTQRKHSIFDDVLGPIMSGPSSSHSAGCARIGKMTQLLYGREISHAEVVFEENGAYPETYIGQGSNFGFTGGLLGYQTDDPRMKDAVKIAKDEGKEIIFRKESLGLHHPNEARIDVFNKAGEVEVSVLTFSTGGGMFEIVRLNGFNVFIDGYIRQLFLCVKEEAGEKWVSWLEEENIPYEKQRKERQILFTIPDEKGEAEEKLKHQEEKQDKTILWLRTAPVIMPAALKKDGEPVFTTAKEALLYNQDKNKEAWELAIDYECSIGLVTREEVWHLAEHVLEIMEHAMTPPDPEETEKYGFLPYQCRDMQKVRMKKKGIDTGVLNEAALSAIAVMENSCAHNLIVAAPTAGSSGVIPGAVIAAGKQSGAGKDELIKALLACGLAGVFIANQASFGAEVAACQAENGSSSAMAAAGVVQLLGGTVQQAFQASSLALQNMLGLVCDPVGGLTEIPCINRNVIAMSNAVMSANMVLWGYDPVIPLDETILSMYEVGQMLPDKLRCTCKGGLCTTPTGECIAEQLKAHRQKL